MVCSSLFAFLIRPMEEGTHLEDGTPKSLGKFLNYHREEIDQEKEWKRSCICRLDCLRLQDTEKRDAGIVLSK